MKLWFLCLLFWTSHAIASDRCAKIVAALPTMPQLTGSLMTTIKLKAFKALMNENTKEPEFPSWSMKFHHSDVTGFYVWNGRLYVFVKVGFERGGSISYVSQEIESREFLVAVDELGSLEVFSSELLIDAQGAHQPHLTADNSLFLQQLSAEVLKAAQKSELKDVSLGEIHRYVHLTGELSESYYQILVRSGRPGHREEYRHMIPTNRSQWTVRGPSLIVRRNHCFFDTTPFRRVLREVGLNQSSCLGAAN